MTRKKDSDKSCCLPGYVGLLLGAVLLLSGCQSRTEAILKTVGEPDRQISVSVSESVLTEEETPVPAVIEVYICGAVERPGVYQLAEGARVVEVIQMAGGLLEAADARAINQARILSDGEQITVLTTEETARQEQSAQAVGEQGGSQGRINLNQASKEQLMTLSGIGEKRAADIIAYRESHGFFTEIEQVRNVSGIGDKLFEQIRELIEV